jgi:proteasome accessory factor BC
MPISTKLQRHLDLIAYLVGRRLPVRVEELMERIPGYAENWSRGNEKGQQSARRTFERDKDELRKTGIPLKTVKYTVDGEDTEGYEITRRDFYLPYLKLVAGDAAPGSGYAASHSIARVEVRRSDAPLALEALRRSADIPSFPLVVEARSAFRKLAFDMDPAVFDRASSVLFIDRPGAAELAERVRALSDALLARKRVRFRYHGIHRGEATDRDVAAYGLLFQHGHWYLIGHDATREDLRVFRIGRIEQIVPNTRSPNQPDYEVPADFKLHDYVGRQAWELGDRDEQPLTAEVSFRFPQSIWAERNRYGRLVRREDDGSTVRAFDVHQVQPFLRWVLSQQSEAEIMSPVELRDELQSLARNIQQAHRSEDDDRD